MTSFCNLCNNLIRCWGKIRFWMLKGKTEGEYEIKKEVYGKQSGLHEYTQPRSVF